MKLDNTKELLIILLGMTVALCLRKKTCVFLRDEHLSTWGKTTAIGLPGV